jgi:hypothetical protein
MSPRHALTLRLTILRRGRAPATLQGVASILSHYLSSDVLNFIETLCIGHHPRAQLAPTAFLFTVSGPGVAFQRSISFYAEADALATLEEVGAYIMALNPPTLEEMTAAYPHPKSEEKCKM